MMAKRNIKYLVIGHLAGIVVLGILLFFIGTGNRLILKGLMAGLLFSLAVQLLLYSIKPGWFSNKIKHYPEQP